MKRLHFPVPSLPPFCVCIKSSSIKHVNKVLMLAYYYHIIFLFIPDLPVCLFECSPHAVEIFLGKLNLFIENCSGKHTDDAMRLKVQCKMSPPKDRDRDSYFLLFFFLSYILSVFPHLTLFTIFFFLYA